MKSAGLIMGNKSGVARVVRRLLDIRLNFVTIILVLNWEIV